MCPQICLHEGPSCLRFRRTKCEQPSANGLRNWVEHKKTRTKIHTQTDTKHTTRTANKKKIELILRDTSLIATHIYKTRIVEISTHIQNEQNLHNTQHDDHTHTARTIRNTVARISHSPPERQRQPEVLCCCWCCCTWAKHARAQRMRDILDKHTQGKTVLPRVCYLVLCFFFSCFFVITFDIFTLATLQLFSEICSISSRVYMHCSITPP